MYHIFPFWDTIRYDRRV